MGTISFSDLKSKLRAFYKRKVKDANTNEIALITRKIVSSRNICWADRHGQTSTIAALKDVNMEGDTEMVDISIENEKQDEDVVPVVPPVQQDNYLKTPVPVVK
jgi:hypothetical protein